MDYTYGIFIYENVAALDFVGPYEVFGISTHLLKTGRVVTIAESEQPITCSNGMQVTPQYSFENAPELDLLLVPGANSLDAALTSKDSIDWIKNLSPSLKFTTAVCTGALILQHAGLLKGKRATTHHMLIDELKKDETIEVLADMRYVRDGNVVTSQGISAGIDMALWLTGQIHTPEHARAVRKLLQYDPAPPYQAEV